MPGSHRRFSGRLKKRRRWRWWRNGSVSSLVFATVSGYKLHSTFECVCVCVFPPDDLRLNKCLGGSLNLPDWLQVCPAAGCPAACALVWLAERSWPYLLLGRLPTRLPKRLQQSRAESWKTASCHHWTRTRDSGLNAAADVTTDNKCSDLLQGTGPSSVRRILFPEPESGCCTPAEIHTLKSGWVASELVPFDDSDTGTCLGSTSDLSAGLQRWYALLDSLPVFWTTNLWKRNLSVTVGDVYSVMLKSLWLTWIKQFRWLSIYSAERAG